MNFKMDRNHRIVETGTLRRDPCGARPSCDKIATLKTNCFVRLRFSADWLSGYSVVGGGNMRSRRRVLQLRAEHEARITRFAVGVRLLVAVVLAAGLAAEQNTKSQ